jgi:transposase
MNDLFWLTAGQMERLKPFFPLSHGVPRVDDRRVLSGIIFINRNGLRWRNAPAAYGPPKTLYNRWVRWSRLGVFARILTELAAQSQDVETVMIDAAHLKAHRTAASLRGKKGVANVSSGAPRAG